jgi:hypothetical protein
VTPGPGPAPDGAAPDGPTPIDSLRNAIGRADALARAAADVLAGAPVDDARSRERVAHLVELAADAAADAWDACTAVIAEIEHAERGRTA